MREGGSFPSVLHHVGHDEAVASTVYVVDFDFGVSLEELAQLGDIDIHAAGVEVVVVHPDGLECQVALEHVVDVDSEECEQFAFLRGELGLLFAEDEHLSLCVEDELAELEAGDILLFLRLDAAQDGFHAIDELVH